MTYFRNIFPLSAVFGLALAVSGCVSTPVPAVAPSATPAPVSTQGQPTPVATPPVEPAVPIEAPQRDDVKAPIIRVLLRVGAEPTFHEPGRPFLCSVGNEIQVFRGPMRARAIAGNAVLQAGAFQQEANARALVLRLEVTGFLAQIDGPTPDGFWRVRVRTRSGESANQLKDRLVVAGFPAPLGAAKIENGSVVLLCEDGRELRGERLRIVAIDPDPIHVGEKAYRGEFELRAGERGVLAINVVNLEQYLRGVVPAEMGPRAFPALEALKAQAVAARTYAVAHLREYDVDGYDICDSTMCQVYDGFGVEHPVTDRAIEETAGEIITFSGQPIDAMYQSTCAGHTEDGGSLFSGRAAPYLKGVVCRGEQVLALGQGTPGGDWIDSTERLAAIGRWITGMISIPADARSLASKLGKGVSGPGAVGLAKAFGLDQTMVLLHRSGPLDDQALIEVLTWFRLPVAQPRRLLRKDVWEMAVTVRLAQIGGDVQAVTGRLIPGPAGPQLMLDGSEVALEIPAGVVVFERRGESFRQGLVEAMVGSAGVLWRLGDRGVALEIEPIASADAGSSWNWWARELTLDDIGKKLGIAGVREIQVLRRGVSGRALALLVVGEEGRQELASMPFRLALELPDTLFIPLPRVVAGKQGVRFVGRGWGHGVGMCQNGAYGLARAGYTYREILKTYYTGVEIGPTAIQK